MRYIIDIETNGIQATLIHCLSYSSEDGAHKDTLYTYPEMITFLSQDDLVIIGHNIVRYDVPTLKRLLKIAINATLIDTLAISYYLDTSRLKHGLESYGDEYGIKKPKVDDWTTLTKEEYGWRCSEDVRINTKLWDNQRGYLWHLYEKDKDKLDNFLAYLTFKMDCVREQEELGLKFDKNHAEETLKWMEKEKEEKVLELKAAMPKVPIVTIKTVPKNLYKADGSLSSRGKDWVDLIAERKLPGHTAEIEVIKGYEDGNPNSHDQLKKWLYSLGWVPEHIKHVRDKKKNTVKQIPQIASKLGGGEICDSIKKLIPKEPALSSLEGLSILSHRIGLFKAFLEDEVDGRLYPSAMGLTNTLRLQHAVVVNLPSVEKKYGKEVRSCLVADPECDLCGSDLSGIEDSTKRHYIWKFDPAYVEEMSQEGFDPHLDIGLLAQVFTKEEVEWYKQEELKKENREYMPSKEDKGKFNALKAIRQKAKVVNFSATYKIGAEALARNSGMILKEARRILKTYWERNKAILSVEKELTVKQVGQQKWQMNPVNGYWYSLRAEKDRFSTLNQGTAVYVFDVWIMYMRQLGLKIAFQYHDEVLFNVHKNRKEYVNEVIKEAIDMTNNRLKLNVKVGCSVQFDVDYASVH